MIKTTTVLTFNFAVHQNVVFLFSISYSLRVHKGCINDVSLYNTTGAQPRLKSLGAPSFGSQNLARRSGERCKLPQWVQTETGLQMDLLHFQLKILPLVTVKLFYLHTYQTCAGHCAMAPPPFDEHRRPLRKI